MKNQKNIKDVTPILTASAKNYFSGTKEIIQLQLDTLTQLNNKTFEEYEKTHEKIKKIKIQNDQNFGVMEEVFKYTLQIEDISKEIDKIEEKEQKLSKFLDKLDVKFEELTTIQNHINQLEQLKNN